MNNEQAEGPCTESDGCPTELAVLQRFWRGQAIPKEREPSWYTTQASAIRVVKEMFKTADKNNMRLGMGGTRSMGVMIPQPEGPLVSQLRALVNKLP